MAAAKTVTPLIHNILVGMHRDNAVRFDEKYKVSLRNEMRELKNFGLKGHKYLFASINDRDTDEIVVVRIK